MDPRGINADWAFRTVLAKHKSDRWMTTVISFWRKLWANKRYKRSKNSSPITFPLVINHSPHSGLSSVKKVEFIEASSM